MTPGPKPGRSANNLDANPDKSPMTTTSISTPTTVLPVRLAQNLPPSDGARPAEEVYPQTAGAGNDQPGFPPDVYTSRPQIVRDEISGKRVELYAPKVVLDRMRYIPEKWSEFMSAVRKFAPEGSSVFIDGSWNFWVGAIKADSFGRKPIHITTRITADYRATPNEALFGLPFRETRPNPLFVGGHLYEAVTPEVAAAPGPAGCQTGRPR